MVIYRYTAGDTADINRELYTTTATRERACVCV